MSKREAVAVMVLLVGFLLFNTPRTAPVGVLLVAGGAYLLALPYVVGYRSGVGRSGRGRRT